MNLQNRIELLLKLRRYLLQNDEEWQNIKHKASLHNGWFTIEFIDLAVQNIVEQFLAEDKLTEWVKYYHLNDAVSPKNVGVVMAGNIPLVGFQDFLCVFISGHKQTIKLSSKDEVLLSTWCKKCTVGMLPCKTLCRLRPCSKVAMLTLPPAATTPHAISIITLQSTQASFVKTVPPLLF